MLPVVIYLGIQGGGALLQQDGFRILIEGDYLIPTLPSLPGLIFPVGRTSHWSNNRHQALSGQKTVNPLWFIPVYQWEIGYSVLRTQLLEWQQFLDFFNSLSGGGSVFYYDDPNDDAVTDEEFGIGDGVTTQFQLSRAIYPGGFSETIQSPIGVIVVKVNGSPTLAFTLGNAGVVTMTSAPANAAILTWTGSYKWLCRFDDDLTALSQFNIFMFEMKKITFSREKL